MLVLVFVFLLVFLCYFYFYFYFYCIGFYDPLESGAANGSAGTEAAGINWMSDRRALGLFLWCNQIVKCFSSSGNYGDHRVFFGSDGTLVIGPSGQVV